MGAPHTLKVLLNLRDNSTRGILAKHVINLLPEFMFLEVLMVNLT